MILKIRFFFQNLLYVQAGCKLIIKIKVAVFKPRRRGSSVCTIDRLHEVRMRRFGFMKNETMILV